MGTEKEKHLYAICKYSGSEEYHIFEANRNEKEVCYITSDTSLCGAIDKSDAMKNDCILICGTIQDVLDKVANTGDPICGNCAGSTVKTEK